MAISWAQKRSRQTSKVDTLRWQAAAAPFTRAVVLFSQGLYEESAEYLYKAVEVVPNSPGIHHYLARIAYMQGDYLRMLTHAEKAYKEAPNELWLALGYASALQLNNQEAEALAVLEKLYSLWPNNPEILLRLAQLYQEKGDLDKADMLYQKLQHLSGNYEEIFQTRIHMFVEAGQIGRAVAIAETLANLWPNHEIYLETGARLCELSRNMNCMIDFVQRLLRIDSANQVAWGVVLDYPEVFESVWGREVWEELLSISSIPLEVRYKLLSQADFVEEEFLERLNSFLRAYPMAVGWELAAQYWRRKGRWDSAGKAWKQAIALDSSQLSYHLAYFYALWQQGGGDSLAAAVERAQELFPGQGRLLIWVGLVQAQQNLWREALSSFQRAKRLVDELESPLRELSAYYTALAEAKLGRLSISTRQQLENLYPAPIGAYLWRIFTLRTGSATEAIYPLPTQTVSPYTEWLNLLLALAQKRPNEALRYALQVENLPNLPLELWEDLLLRFSETEHPEAYARWKTYAKAAYPLAPLWRTLP
ncbi:MAG: tetratricopeptide repeat protein [Bacteroidia bacterium]